jgi:hypothetical protein
LIDPVWIVALSHAVAKMTVVVDAPSIDAAVVSLTVTAELALINSTETLEFVVSNDACIEVSKSDSLFAENSSVSTDFVNNKTSVTVSDTHAESFEGASTTAGILATEYDVIFCKEDLVRNTGVNVKKT